MTCYTVNFTLYRRKSITWRLLNICICVSLWWLFSWIVVARHVKPCFFFFLWRCDPTWIMASLFLRFLDHAQRCTTVGRTPLDEWSAHRRDLYLTPDSTQHPQQTNIHAPGGIWIHDLSRQAAAHLHLRQHGHWDWHVKPCIEANYKCLKKFLHKIFPY